MSSFSESDPRFDPKNLTDEQRRAFAAGQAAAAQLFSPDKEIQHIMSGDDVRAAYKIEIMFGPRRTPAGPNKCLVSIYESGKYFHGGGDDLMFWCKDVTNPKQPWGESPGCGSPIPPGAVRGGVAYCAHCKRMLNAEKLAHVRFCHYSTKSLARLMNKLWHELKCNADIYCKYDRSDIRVRAQEESIGEEEAWRLRGLFIYPLKNILKDTAAGAAAEKRFYSFLSS